MLGRRITGKRLGILGMGRIGQALARRARAFGLSIHYHNRRRLPADIEEGLEATYWDSLDQMLARMDMSRSIARIPPRLIISCQPGASNICGPTRSSSTRRAARWIDENALTRMLEADEIAGVGPRRVRARARRLGQADPPRRNGKVILLPHMGSATREGRNDMGDKVIVNIKTFVDGHRPPDRVLPSML